MNWDSLCSFIVFAGSAYILLWFILIRPLNIRYKHALATLLGKEIARSLYQQMHPGFTYENKYHPSDRVDEIVLEKAKETLKLLLEKEKENMNIDNNKKGV